MRTLVVSLCLVLLACGSKSSDQPKAGSGSAGSGSGSATGAGSATGSGSAGSAVPVANEPTTLPKGDGTPPKKTTKKLADPDFKRLSEIEHPTFGKRVRNAHDGLDLLFTTTRPRLGVSVTITPCLNCPPMVLEKWKEREADDLKYLLGDELRNRPDTTWEMGTVDLNGQLLVFTYQVGHYFGKDDQGNPHASYSDAYALYYNDGINQIRIVAEYQDSPVSREQMIAVAPKEDLAKLALAFLDFYTHHW